MEQKILITGASGGFGYLTCKSLIDKGHQVVGTMRSTTGKNEKVANELKSIGVHLVEMDVTNENSVNNGVKKAIDVLNGLDVLINNAGVGVFGMQEHFTPDDMKYVFDVNVFGVQRVMRATLPFFRKQKKGTVLYISSLLGRITEPFFGVYNASKWALEAIADNYRTELSVFGIESCIVEPGGYPTTFIENLVKPSDNSRNESYGEFMKAPNAMINGYIQSLEANSEQRPHKVADAISNLIAIPHGEKPLRTIVDYTLMGEHINKYNEMLHNVTLGIFSAFGIEGMLHIKK